MDLTDNLAQPADSVSTSPGPGAPSLPPPAARPAPAPAATPAAPVPAPPAPAATSDRVPRLAWLIAALFVAAELAFSDRYGFLQDELYFIVAGHHLAFGYVDQPPIAPLLTRITGVFGVSPTAVRIVPALAGGAMVAAAAKFAALFGARRPGRVLAALATACAPVILGAMHVGNTTPFDLVAWTMVLLCVAIALLRDRPRFWLAAGVAAGLGLESDNLMVMLLIGIGLGLLVSPQRAVLRTRWPWAAAAIAAVIWAPNLAWQGSHGWPQLAMAAALHHENSSVADYAAGLPGQVIYLGLLIAPILVAGFVRIWRTPELRFMAVAATLIVVYVLLWIPGKTYYADGVAPAVLAAGAAAAEGWVARGRRPRLRHGLVIAAPLAGLVLLPGVLPVVPVGNVHTLPASTQQSTLGDTIGWPQLTAAVAAQNTALITGGQRPTSIFTGYYAEAGALDVLGGADHLPAVLSGQNAYWMWGPGHASDQTVLAVDALPQLRPYFRSCRLLATYHAPYQVQNDWTGIQIAVCTKPVGSWDALWPHLKYYG